jgi:PfaD family protein
VEAEASDAAGAADTAAVLGPARRVLGVLPPLYPEWLGARSFTDTYGCRFAYVVGEMARGIATAQMVIAALRAGMFGFFGSAGLRPPVIAEAIAQIKAGVDNRTAWGANLIHSPDYPELERAVVDLFVAQGVRHVSASAFMRLSPEIVRYAAHGLARGADGTITRATHVFAKISRPEVAAQFMAPPPAGLLRELAAAGRITTEQAELQSRIPVATDITVEADSGGHTDNRPLAALFPTIAALRQRLIVQHGFTEPLRLGAAGGLGTPGAVAAAFQLGADYVLTGSVNQGAVESGLSPAGRRMLADCGLADVTMAPAADMFELGVKVQVLKRGTMFAIKAQRLYELYRRHDGIEALPERERRWLETQVFAEGTATAWSETRAFHAGRDPALAAKADGDPKLRMALIFRRYLFMGAQWARSGATDRAMDFQIWCGPAMGAFNDWVKGSHLETLDNRTVEQIGLNLIEGAAVLTRAQQLRAAGVDVPAALFEFKPRALALA